MFEGTDWVGNYGRFPFDETDKYLILLKEMGVPIQAEEFNLLQEIQMTFVRKLIKTMIGDGAFEDAFKIIGTGATNDFSITAGKLLLDGWLPELDADVLYSAQAYSQSALTTPSGADRADEVYLDVWHEEIDDVEDTDILNPAIGVRTYCMWQMRWAVKVAEGSTTPADGVDGNNKYHWHYKLATINRVDGNALITAGMVVDERGNAPSTLINLGSDADGDIYYRNAGILKRLAKGTDGDMLEMISGVPAWKTSPSFSVHKNGADQSINNSTETKLTWSTELFDTNSDFASNKFTPQVAGKYLLTAGLAIGASLGDQKIMAIRIYKNGSELHSVRNSGSGTIECYANISVVVDADGSSDYFEIYAWQNSGLIKDIQGESYKTWFTGSRVS